MSARTCQSFRGQYRASLIFKPFSRLTAARKPRPPAVCKSQGRPVSLAMSAFVPARPHFSFRRIGALIRRHWYLLRGSWPRLFDLVYWPTVQLATWGFLQLYLTKRTDVAAAAA